MNSEYINNQCQYCGHRTQRKIDKAMKKTHVKNPKNFVYLYCDTCKEYSCMMKETYDKLKKEIIRGYR